MQLKIAKIFMTNEIIVDANVLVAFFDTSDVWNKQATLLLTTCNEQRRIVLYLDCVINETVNVIVRRLNQKQKSNSIPKILAEISSYILAEDIHTSSHLFKTNFKSILSTITKCNGTLSFTDSLIVEFMKEANLPQLLSFDTDFDSVPGIERIHSAKQIL